MFNNYSGTFFSVIAMVLVPALVQVGFSQSCAGEFATIVPSAVVGAIILLWRRSKGDVTLLGTYKPLP